MTEETKTAEDQLKEKLTQFKIDCYNVCNHWLMMSEENRRNTGFLSLENVFEYYKMKMEEAKKEAEKGSS